MCKECVSKCLQGEKLKHCQSVVRQKDNELDVQFRSVSAANETTLTLSKHETEEGAKKQL
jgi:hypothetical protein